MLGIFDELNDFDGAGILIILNAEKLKRFHSEIMCVS